MKKLDKGSGIDQNWSPNIRREQYGKLAYSCEYFRFRDCRTLNEESVVHRFSPVTFKP